MLLTVDVVVDDSVMPDQRPAPGSAAIVELRDISLVDDAAVTLARRATDIGPAGDRHIVSAELAVDAGLDPRADLTVWVRVTETPHDDLAVGDWITMQTVPVDPEVAEQRVVAPVRRVG
jgi:hypothetical protein